MICAYVLLPAEGGEVTIETRLQEIGGRCWVEFTVTSTSASALAVGDEDLFRPFLRVNGYPLGLSLALVEQLVSRQQGRIVFRQTSPGHGCFTLTLPA
jgi:signal transduction histidine kinase